MSAPPKPAPHAGMWYPKLLGGLGLSAALLGAFWVLTGTAAAGVLLIGFGALAAYGSFYYHALFTAVQINNIAVQYATSGRIDEAEALLATIPERARRGGVKRAGETLRGMIALHAGRTDEAATHFTLAMEGSVGFFNAAFQKGQRATALSFRALAYAALGDVAGAEADATAAEANEYGSPDTIARSRLARTLVAARRGDDAKVDATLSASGSMMLEYAIPRERALVRALRKMARARKSSIYRESAKPSEGAERGKVAGWIAAIAPEAAAFADEERVTVDRADTPAMPPASEREMRAIAGARAKATPKKPLRRVVLLWVILIVLFLAIWQFLTPSAEQPHRHAPPPEPLAMSTTPFAVAFFALFVVFAARINIEQRRQRSLARGRRLAAQGDVVGARAILSKTVTAQAPILASAAGYELAKLAAADADFVSVVALVEPALARLNARLARAGAVDLLIPALITELAIAKAVLGRYDEADAEVAMLTRDFPGYAYLGASQARFVVVRQTRAGNLVAAAAAARTRTADMPIPLREELLCDLVIAKADGLPRDERERLDEELAADPKISKWIDVVAPGLR